MGRIMASCISNQTTEPYPPHVFSSLLGLFDTIYFVELGTPTLKKGEKILEHHKNITKANVVFSP